MKKTLAIVLLFVGIALTASAKGNHTFVQGKMPDAYDYLPPPPNEVGSDEAWLLDSALYVSSKALRDTPRGERAVEDASFEIDHYMKRISEVYGKTLTKETYPALAYVLEGAYNDTRSTISKAKKNFARPRPYVHFNDSTPVLPYKGKNAYTSYPSGHSTRAWTVAMVMTMIDPAHAAGYAKMGYDMGVSRMIVGFHYYSDVEAARLAASMGFARLCAEKSFLKAVKKARKELEK